METVAVVRSKYCGKSQLDVPGVIDHGNDIGEGQVQLLLADGGVCGPGEVTAEASEVNRRWVSQVRISDNNVLCCRHSTMLVSTSDMFSCSL